MALKKGRSAEIMFCAISEDSRSLYYIFTLLLPATLYAMGIMEGRKGHYLFLSGLVVHLFSIILRGVEIGTLPLTEKHDTISFMAFCVAAAFLYLKKNRVYENIGMMVLPLAAALLCVAAAYEPINTIPPFQRSPWFYLHMFFYFSSYGFFGISACVGIYFLMNREAAHEVWQYRAAAYGWILFSAALITGSIWFFVAYGTYWLWTSRELWTALAWFWYGLYLHARMMKGFRGMPASVIGIAGFALMLFVYFGVGRVIPSPPTQF